MMRSLLILLTYFCLHTWLGIPQAKCQVELSMMDNAFDDQYIGCVKEMDGIAPGLLEKETSMSLVFSREWENSEEKWERVKRKVSVPTGFKDEHGRAIIAYTDEDFHQALNAAVKVAGTSRAHYMASFQFKAFHYYLTRAMQLLRGRCDVTYKRTLYRGVKTQHTRSSKIRFGQFASSSFDIDVAKGFGTATLFTIHTCFGVEIGAFSYHPQQKEVLIPVHEIFSTFPGQESNSFVLRSINQTCSHFNCAYLGGEKNQACVNNTATRGGLAFPGDLSPSLFGGSVILVHVAALKLFDSF